MTVAARQVAGLAVDQPDGSRALRRGCGGALAGEVVLGLPGLLLGPRRWGGGTSGGMRATQGGETEDAHDRLRLRPDPHPQAAPGREPLADAAPTDPHC